MAVGEKGPWLSQYKGPSEKMDHEKMDHVDVTAKGTKWLSKQIINGVM